MVKDGGAHAGRRQVSLASEGAEEGETRRVTEAKSFRHIIPPCVYRLGWPSMEVKKIEAKTILDEIPKPNVYLQLTKSGPPTPSHYCKECSFRNSTNLPSQIGHSFNSYFASQAKNMILGRA
jgi:hypothetical protein